MTPLKSTFLVLVAVGGLAFGVFLYLNGNLDGVFPPEQVQPSPTTKEADAAASAIEQLDRPAVEEVAEEPEPLVVESSPEPMNLADVNHAARAKEEFVTLTDPRGRELTAQILEVGAGFIKVIRQADQRIFEIEAQNLSDEDREFASYLWRNGMFVVNSEIGPDAKSISMVMSHTTTVQAYLVASRDKHTWDPVTLLNEDGAWATDHDKISVQAVMGLDGRSTLSLIDRSSGRKLFLRAGKAVEEGSLGVYRPVPGLEPSPYYRLSVQKVSELNHGDVSQATNWQLPFAWFTKCKDHDRAEKSAYFSQYIGSWSQTYCNIALDAHTPIVFKITRLDKPGAPSGPIQDVSVRPAHRIDKWEIINGEVYVWMSHPALIAVDIDKQLDSRDAPRVEPDVWGGETFPYNNEKDGVHAVTLFANPFIEDKPDPRGPNVYAVEPGTLPPKSGSWDVLYFKPGIHKWSVDRYGREREWKPSDAYLPESGKSYYIPGDAIVYGNFSDPDYGNKLSNVRIFGHGTLSGLKIPHFNDFEDGPLPGKDRKHLRMMYLTSARSSMFEGITVADPAEHGAYIEGPKEDYPPNYIRWVKNIAWRVNNDGGGVTGNGYVEDCFFRHQDDALYVRGMGIRRSVFWTDVNGMPLRCSFITGDRGSDYPESLPEKLIVEDLDIIYARAVFAFTKSRDLAVIGTPGGVKNKVLADGTLNTGQHLLFRNIRITDPRPVRYLLGFVGEGKDSGKVEGWAGLQFENINFEHPHTWGWTPALIGGSDVEIKDWLFKDVYIGGEKVDRSYFNDPSKFRHKYASDFIFQ